MNQKVPFSNCNFINPKLHYFFRGLVRIDDVILSIANFVNTRKAIGLITINRNQLQGITNNLKTRKDAETRRIRKETSISWLQTVSELVSF